MAQILERLEALGITAERKSIYRDIEALREFGLDVRTYQRAPVEYAAGAARVRVRTSCCCWWTPCRAPASSRSAKATRSWPA